MERFASSLSSSDAPVLASVGDYVEWQTKQRAADFTPKDDDDVGLRTYLMYLRADGANQPVLEERVAALKWFYGWAQTEGDIAHSPFDDYNFDDPLLTSEQIQPTQKTLPDDLRERELERLRA